MGTGGAGVNTLVGGAGADTIVGGAGVDVIRGDNQGTKEVQTATMTYNASADDVLTVNGVAITAATGANLAASVANMVTAINASASLANIVVATNNHATTAGQIILTYLTDGNAIAAVDTTSSGTTTVAEVTAGTTGTSSNNVMTGGDGADIFVITLASTTASATVFQTINGFATASDIIDYAPLALTIVSDANAAAAGTANISTAGIATFHANDDELGERIIATQAAIVTDGNATAGQVAAFMFGTDAYVFISEGTDGIGAGDQLIKLVGVDLTNAAFNVVTLANGNMTLA